ncbi:ubiquitin carboxyl-terminal hydrolase-domain-containing protein [Dipodascopsis uninucleata]
MEGWREASRVSTLPFGSLPASISTVTFDTSQELLWTGDTNGRVASFAGENLRKYTSFIGHRAPVSQILVNDRGVLSLGPNNLRMTQRRGLVRFNLDDQGKMKELCCMSYTSRGTSEIIIGGRNPGLLKINVDRGSIVSEVPLDERFTVMRRGGRLIACGNAKGEVVLLDPVSLQVVRKLPAHSGGIADLDTRDNVLLTCGHTYRGAAYGASYPLDPLLNIYDLRTFRPQPPVPFPAGAGFVRLHPKMSTTCIVSSLTGQLQILDFVNPAHAFLHQSNLSYVTSLDISSSGDYFALGDNDGAVHIWRTPDASLFTEFGRPTEWPDAIVDTTPTLSANDIEVPLNTVGMPYYRDKLLSAWPGEMIFNVARRSPPIDQEILSNMKTVDFVGYAPFPKRHKRYVTESLTFKSDNNSDGKVPMFRSEQDRHGQSSILTKSMNDDDPIEPFRKVEIKYSRFGVEDFDFGFYNRTPYAGLETHLPNSYTNALLQLYRFIPLVYSFSLHHVAGNCTTEKCLLCELGFLFDMLSKADGQHCRAYNFVRTLSSIHQASALGILEEDFYTKRTPLASMMQSFNRFLLERTSMESRSYDMSKLSYSGITQMEKIAGVDTTAFVRCSTCSSEASRHGTTYVSDLLYPKNVEIPNSGRSTSSGIGQIDRRPPNLNIDFITVLRQSLETSAHTRGWCDKCRRYQMLSSSKRIQKLSPVLVLNTAVDSPVSRQIWSQKNFLPLKFETEIADDSLRIKRVSDSTEPSKKANTELYELVGVVVEVNFGVHDNHMVSVIRVPKENGIKEWYLFNDFLVKPFPESEALRFDYTWKTPVVVIYQSCDAKATVFDDSWKNHLDTSLLYSENALNANERAVNFEYESLKEEEAPKPGTMIAIDAEFVALEQEETEVRSDGTRSLIRPSRLSLARVSVVRGDGKKSGIAFIDDYITTTDNIADYLTEFSGINIGDLDPGKSNKSLVPLKTAYKKLWLLLNIGCIFVGHGLANDFRTINIQVPRNQVIDTVDIYYIKSRQRKLSLRFLAWYLLKQNIQTETHDSIEDAKTALYLYEKYKQICEQGGKSAFDNILNEIYNEGRAINFRPPMVSSDTTITMANSTTAVLTKEVRSNDNTKQKKITTHIVEL